MKRASDPGAAVTVQAGARSAALLRLSNVTKTYGEGAARVEALRGIDLEIHKGEFVVIMGSSGSGKSTAMNVLGCLDVPSSGHYFIEDVAVEELQADVLARLRNIRFGFVFQGFNLLPRTSALDNAQLPLIYAGVPARVRAARAKRALAVVGLAGRESAMPNQLSGGQQQRVAIARALVNEPEVLLADEPTGNLDTKTSHEIMGTLAHLNQELGLTIVMVTHEPDVARYGSRIITFRDGRIESDRAQAPMPLQSAS
ncbi:MAG TPA: ABC transporter ATP-binding protein [Polyangiales bacterium]